MHDIAVHEKTVYLATDKGLGIIRYQPYTLQKKVAYYENIVNTWGHKRLGFVHKLYWDNKTKLMSIIPNTRLIIAAGLVFPPAAILVAAVPDYGIWGLALSIAFVAFAFIDAFLSRHLLDGIQISLPTVLRVSLGRAVDAPVQVDRTDGCPNRFRIGLALPRIAVKGEVIRAVQLEGQAVSHFVYWPLHGLRQGQWHLKRCFLETASRLGLWGMRQHRDLDTEIRIYPSLLRERRQLSGLFLNRGIGIHVQRQVGKGKEFEQLRDYLPGDSMEDIHWKASARRNSPITKVYQIERTQQVYVVLDASRLSGRRLLNQSDERPDPPERTELDSSTILERFTVATLLLALAAERQGDHFGLISFDDRIRSFIPAKSGKAHFGTCRDAIYNLNTRLVSPDFSEVFTFIGSRLRRRALLVFLTSLDDPLLAESFSESIEIISRRHIILVNMLKTEGIDPLFCGPAVDTLDDVYARLSGHLLWRRITEVEKVLQHRGIRFALMDNASLCPELIGRYLDIKRRQVL